MYWLSPFLLEALDNKFAEVVAVPSSLDDLLVYASPLHHWRLSSPSHFVH